MNESEPKRYFEVYCVVGSAVGTLATGLLIGISGYTNNAQTVVVTLGSLAGSFIGAIIHSPNKVWSANMVQSIWFVSITLGFALGWIILWAVN